MHIIPYIRVSTTRQAQEGHSLEAQSARISAWASQHGHTVGQPFADEGLSGGRADNRPELQKAIAAACEQKAALCVVSLSRLARSTTDAIEIVTRLEQAGAQLVSLTEQIDTTSAVGKLFFKLMAALAEFERELISERTQSVLDYKRANSQRISRYIPYGFDLAENGTDLLPNPQEQQVIEQMLAQRTAGDSYKAIVKQLEQGGVKTKLGKDRWTAMSVRNVLLRQAAS